MFALNENIGQIYKIHTRYQRTHLSFYHRARFVIAITFFRKKSYLLHSLYMTKSYINSRTINHLVIYSYINYYFTDLYIKLHFFLIPSSIFHVK